MRVPRVSSDGVFSAASSGSGHCRPSHRCCFGIAQRLPKRAQASLPSSIHHLPVRRAACQLGCLAVWQRRHAEYLPGGHSSAAMTFNGQSRAFRVAVPRHGSANQPAQCGSSRNFARWGGHLRKPAAPARKAGRNGLRALAELLLDARSPPRLRREAIPVF
jgi:hypothetical protein